MTITTIKSGQNIPKGYAVAVTTWENDGDNYKTKTVYGLDEKEVLFTLELVGIFKSDNSHDMEDVGIGNADIEDVEPDKLESALREEFNMPPCPTDDAYWWGLIGTWCDGGYIRVFDSAEVYWYSEPVVSISGMFDKMKENT